MIEEGRVSPPEAEDIEINFGEVIEENQLHGVPEIYREVMACPISGERISELRQRFYPDFSDDEITIVERTAIFQFQKYSRIAKWVYNPDNPQPRMEDYGVSAESPLADRLAVIDRLSQDAKTNPVFANLEWVENFLNIDGHPTLRQEVTALLEKKGNVDIVDVGCGGQAADIQLLFEDDLKDKALTVTGVSAYDYGKNIKEGFPELGGKIRFRHMNLYTDKLPRAGDLVFSARTLPYTGVIDAVRFCASLHDMAKEDGTVWIEDVEEDDFDFRDSGFGNLAEYLDGLRQKYPSLKYDKERGDYVIYWKKEEGFPFEGLKAKGVKYDPSGMPYLVRYGPETSGTEK